MRGSVLQIVAQLFSTSSADICNEMIHTSQYDIMLQCVAVC